MIIAYRSAGCILGSLEHRGMSIGLSAYFSCCQLMSASRTPPHSALEALISEPYLR